MFLDLHAVRWGTFDAETLEVSRHRQPKPGDDDLLDLAAADTLLHRGKVYPVSQDQIITPVAAIFRY